MKKALKEAYPSKTSDEIEKQLSGIDASPFIFMHHILETFQKLVFGTNFILLHFITVKDHS